MMVKALIFDWGDTVMRDYAFEGPMYAWDKVDWIPGAEELLKRVQEKFICIIATSADHSGKDDMIKALKRVEADNCFQQFYSQKELGFKKPDPRFFEAVINKAGLLPDECVMIGNMYEKDIVGAKSAGLKTIFFNENELSGDFPLADAIVNQMKEISIDLIRRLK